MFKVNNGNTRTRCEICSLKLQISCLLWGKSSVTFRQLYGVDSLWNAYLTWQEHNSQMYRTDKYSQHRLTIRPVWLNVWLFVYKLSGLWTEWLFVRVQLQSLSIILFAFIIRWIRSNVQPIYARSKIFNHK